MSFLFKSKKINARRQSVRHSMATARFTRLTAFVNSPYPKAVSILIVFIAAVWALLGLDLREDSIFLLNLHSFVPWPQLVALLAVVTVISVGMALYVRHYEKRILSHGGRMFAIAAAFWLLLAITRIVSISVHRQYVGVGPAVGAAIILTIAYDQRFAIGMSMFYALLAAFAVARIATVDLLLLMTVGALSCCFLLREIRTRKKLIEVSIFSTLIVFMTAAALGALRQQSWQQYWQQAGYAAAATFVVGIFIQAFLPIIESAFGIATSMTLLDYSDANQPLLRKLAMDAPGTFSHSLLIGSIAESAAEAIGANGLLCRVGAYYHDIGKLHKAPYFVENQMNSANLHDQLTPAMSQLIIVGHVKDGIEIAREFGLPAVIRQFIETHHGTTLMEYFYHEARKRQDGQSPVSETEFRYPGPKPRTREAAIVMLADAAESASRTMPDHSPAKVETLVHNIAMKRLQDGQFDECDLTLRELSLIESSMSKALAAHHHGRIVYPKPATKDDSADAGDLKTPVQRTQPFTSWPEPDKETKAS
ncbi:MAG: HDIG domain-containing protein [Planctomycetaceae bacterium]|nr:HDIG domain-containing protein [Planctomycetaceae bacterium]